MKPDLHGSPATVPPATTNGVHRAARKSGPALKRPSGSTHRLPALPDPVASFVSLKPVPVDAEMWPLHPALWFQPELGPTMSQWSGLAIERHSRLPAPDFALPKVEPLNHRAALDVIRDALAPVPLPEIPQCGLAPLGWDPRTICRKEERE